MSAFQRAAKNDAVQRVALMLGGIIFGVGLFLAIRSQPQLLQNLKLGPVFLVLALGVPLTILANAFEFKLIGASVQRRIPFFRSLEISIIASAANMLPLPGGAVARVAALKAYEVRYSDGIQATLIFALLWVSLAFVFAGVCLLIYVFSSIGWLFLLFSLLIGGTSFIWSIGKNVRLRIFGWAVAQRLLIVLLDGLRLWWCFLALGVDASFTQAGTLVVGGVIGSAVSLVPAGLGIREGVSAGLAPIVGLAAAAGFMAAGLNRILALAILTPSALLIELMKKRK